LQYQQKQINSEPAKVINNNSKENNNLKDYKNNFNKNINPKKML